MNDELTQGIEQGIINLKLRFLLHLAEHKEDGVTSAELTKYFNVSYAYASVTLAKFEESGYVTTLITKNKREKRRILTDKAYQLFYVIGVL